MILILCLDDDGGMMFNGRRQSFDSAVINDILLEVGDGRIWMNDYSYKIFEEYEEVQQANIKVDQRFLNRAQKGEYCFWEGVVRCSEKTVPPQYAFRDAATAVAVLNSELRKPRIVKVNDTRFLEAFKAKTEKLIIYRWNRKYPYDKAFEVGAFTHDRPSETCQFEGSSHNKITKEIYDL